MHCKQNKPLNMDGGTDKITDKINLNQPQCKFFVVRKKRLCRMTVRPGRDYCGEHEPQPKDEDDKVDTRVPCPYDPKHTCYASKLLKHLTICNARQTDSPDYIIHNVNASPASAPAPRLLLNQIPQQKILAVIDKVNILYDKYVKDTVTTAPDRPIHDAVLADFTEEGRAEGSLRHLRQASSLLHLLEAEGLARDGTCYVELGAGKGLLSYYAHRAWCADGAASRVLLVDRAALRHKRDGKLPRASRVRADLAHLALERVPQLAPGAALVGLAKHLCGVATDTLLPLRTETLFSIQTFAFVSSHDFTAVGEKELQLFDICNLPYPAPDYALRCLTRAGAARRVRGAVLATCCHHRCEPPAYVAAHHLQEMGISAEDLNVMLGAVSWATCGDGCSRARRAASPAARAADTGVHSRYDDDAAEARARAGRRAKALLDHGRVRYLQQHGFRARLCRYVPPHVSLENVAIVARRDDAAP